MKTPPLPRLYYVDELNIDGGTAHGYALRAVECAICPRRQQGPSNWLGGNVTRDTHVRVLRETLRLRCDRDDCPHPQPIESEHRP